MKHILSISFLFLLLLLFPKFVFSTTIPKVIYTINKPVDQSGSPVTSTKIYVDDLYTHHLDDEILYFCEGCFCDDDKIVPCGLGQHQIELIKTGFSNWLDVRNFILGENYEVSPVLVQIAPTPTPTETIPATETPAPTPTSTQTPAPTPAKSIYKINKPKDQDGQLITSVKIYIDNLYTHHEDDEILEFCDNCFCDNDKTIPCGFGEHTIKLIKTGYADWSEQRTISQGSNYETTPILTKLSDPTSSPASTSTPSPTSTPTKTSTPTPTKKPTVTPTIAIPTLFSTVSGVLGESTDSASLSASVTDEITVTPTTEKKISKPQNYKTPFFIGLFLAISSGATLYFRHRKD